MELIFDDQKREISDHGVWIRKVLASLETVLKVRGVAILSDEIKQSDNPASSDSDTRVSDDENRPNDFSFQEDADDYYSREREMAGSSRGSRRSKHELHRDDTAKRRTSSPRRFSDDRFNRKRSQKIDTFMKSYEQRSSASASGSSFDRDRRRHAPRFALNSSLDDFDFIQYSSSQQRDMFLSDLPISQPGLRPANIRFSSKKRPMERSDPRWNWFKMGQLKEQSRVRDAHAKSHTQSMVSENASASRHTIHPQRSHKRKLQEQLLGHVQNARLQLREKRSNGTRGAVSAGTVALHARGYGTGYDPPLQMMDDSAARSGAVPQDSTQRAGGPPRATLSASAFGSNEFAPTKPLSYTTGKLATSAQPATADICASSSPSESRIKWEDAFEILADTIGDDELPVLSPLRRHFLMTCGLAECTCGRHTSVHEDSAAEAEDANDLGAIKRLAIGLRQSLTELRFQETAFMKSLSGGGSLSAGTTSDGDTSYTSSREWQALVDAADRYHASLASFRRHSVQCVREGMRERASGVVCIVRDVVVEVSSTIGQLPDCESLFESCRPYVFFFEVADRLAKITPLLTAITRTYWFSIRLLLDLKDVGATASEFVASPDLVRAVESAAESILPTNRAILAASLFLVDLYLYLPSAYRFDRSYQPTDEAIEAREEDDESVMPVISLWLLLYDCFSSGKCSFQTGKLTGSGDGRDFWAFLQAMVRVRWRMCAPRVLLLTYYEVSCVVPRPLCGPSCDHLHAAALKWRIPCRRRSDDLDSPRGAGRCCGRPVASPAVRLGPLRSVHIGVPERRLDGERQHHVRCSCMLTQFEDQEN